MVALLLAPMEEVRKLQLEALVARGMDALAESARVEEQMTRRLGPAFHMPVVDLALPAVKQAPENVRRELVAALEAVIHADRRISLHEFVVLTLLRSQLAPRGKPGDAGNRKLAELKDPALILLSLVAHAGTRQDAVGQRSGDGRGAVLAAAVDHDDFVTSGAQRRERFQAARDARRLVQRRDNDGESFRFQS